MSGRADEVIRGVEGVLPGESATARAAHESLKGNRRGIRKILPFLGPAFIVAVAYVDPGNIATNISGGGAVWVFAVVGYPHVQPHGHAHPVDVGQAGDRDGQESARGLPGAFSATSNVLAVGPGRGHSDGDGSG